MARSARRFRIRIEKEISEFQLRDLLNGNVKAVNFMAMKGEAKIEVIEDGK